jgi:hypothetical protein
MTFNSHDSLKVNFQNILFINKKIEQVLYRHSPSMKNNNLDKSRGQRRDSDSAYSREQWSMNGVHRSTGEVLRCMSGVQVEYKCSTDGL